MNDVEARKAIQREIHNRWTHSDMDVAWQGQVYEPKADRGYIQPFFSVEMTSNQDLGGDVGNRFFQRQGAVHINVYVPITNEDSFKAHTLALELRDMFEGNHIQDLWFWECKATPAGRDGDYMVAYANCAFQFQEIK